VAAKARGVAAAAASTRPLTLLSNFSWTLLGNLIYAGCQWGMLVVLAKLGSPEAVGLFALGLAVSAPVIIFANLQLRGVQATDAKHEHPFGHYLAVRLFTTVLAVVAIAAISWAAGYRGATMAVIVLVTAAKAMEAISDALYGLMQQRHRMDYIARSMILRGGLSLLALAGVMYLMRDVIYGVTVLAIVWAAVLVLHDFPAGARTLRGVPDAVDGRSGSVRALAPRWEAPAMLRLLRLAFPLGFVMLLTSLSANAPLYFIERHRGVAELGMFAAASYLTTVGMQLVASLGQAATPHLAAFYAAGRYGEFKKLLLKLLGVSGIVGAAGVLITFLAGGEILGLVYGPEYAGQEGVFIWLMIAAAVAYVGSLLGFAITATRAFNRFAGPYSVVAVVSVVASALLVPTYGLYGAAWTNGLVAIAVCLAACWVLLRARVSHEPFA
jgi:O-antigen/teichoic acid export membrane protein